jgi:tellurite resistance protein
MNFSKKEQQLIVNVMIIMARSDGKVHVNEKIAIGAVCHSLGINISEMEIPEDNPLNFLIVEKEIGKEAREIAMTVCHSIMESDGYVDIRESSTFDMICKALGISGHKIPKVGLPNPDSYKIIQKVMQDYVKLLNENPDKVKAI